MVHPRAQPQQTEDGLVSNEGRWFCLLVIVALSLGVFAIGLWTWNLVALVMT